MPHACVRLRPRPPYHGDTAGKVLKRMGYAVSPQPMQQPRPRDVLVIWNRYANEEAAAARYEAAGASVLVVENGYWGRDFQGAQWYALALGQHNGCGRWAKPNPARWESLGIDLKPWRRDGEEIVILAQRGIGSRLVAEPRGWEEQAAALLRRRTKRPVRVRKHPGPQGTVPPVSLADDLANAWAAVTWGSSAGLHAIALGVPVFHGLENWIGKTAARPFEHDLEAPHLGDRAQMFAGVASAMWRLDEIESGEAFRCLLG